MQAAQQKTMSNPKPHHRRAKLEGVLLNWFIPRAANLQKHPLYQMELRRHRNMRPLASLLRYSLPRFAWMSVFWALAWLVVVTIENNSWYGFLSYRADYAGGRVILLTVFIGLGLNLLLDFSAIIASVDSINRERESANWHLVSVSTISRTDVVMIKQTVAQVRVWRMVTAVMAVRIATLVLLFLHSVGVYIWFEGLGEFLSEFGYTIIHQPLESLLALYIVGSLAFVCVTEPLWRVRAVTAVGVWVSARVRGGSSAMLAGFAGVVLVSIIQALLGIFVLWVTVILVENINTTNLLVNDSIILIAFSSWLVIFYAYYHYLRMLAMYGARKAAFRE